MLAGKPPFVDNAVSAVLARHMGDTPEPLPSHVPAKLRAVVEQLLAKRPEERIQTAGEVHKILDDVREGPGFGAGATPLSYLIPDTPDTIPDIHAALAETHAASSNPSGMVVSMPPSVTELTSPVKPRRYAIVAFFAVIPLGVLAFVMMNTRSRGHETPRAVAGMPKGAAMAGSDTAAGSGSSAEVGTPDVVVGQTRQPVDAGVDAGLDAGVVGKKTAVIKKVPKLPKARPDAGASEPDIDFIRSGK